MHHAFLDRHSDLNSLIHRLDPRIKIISFLLYILFVVSTPPLQFDQFILYFFIIFIVIVMSRVPVGYIIKRSLVIIPFVLLTAVFIPFFKSSGTIREYDLGMFHLHISSGGLLILLNVLIKSWLAVTAMIMLSSTVKFPLLLKGMESLKVPGVMIMLLSFMYRYIFVLADEAMRMERARNSRYFGGNYWRQIKVFGNIIGLLFIRAYERGERVYQSMIARGFDGSMRTLNGLKLLPRDVSFFIIFIVSLIGVKLQGIL